jgi:hypothetical protein
VKFLVDNQLPRALATLLGNLGHHAVHVLDIELSQVDDMAIWAFAAQNGYTIISKDADFADLALLYSSDRGAAHLGADRKLPKIGAAGGIQKRAKENRAGTRRRNLD